ASDHGGKGAGDPRRVPAGPSLRGPVPRGADADAARGGPARPGLRRLGRPPGAARPLLPAGLAGGAGGDPSMAGSARRRDEMSAIVTAQALMHFLWQGALVGLAAWIALTLLERAKASTRYAVALGALLLMAALPFATAFWLAGETPRPAPAAVDAMPAAAPIVKTPEAAGGTATVQPFGASLLPWIFDLWLAGVAALSLVHLGGFRRVRHLSQQGRPMAEALQSIARDLGRRLGIRRAVALLES